MSDGDRRVAAGQVWWLPRYVGGEHSVYLVLRVRRGRWEAVRLHDLWHADNFILDGEEPHRDWERLA